MSAVDYSSYQYMELGSQAMKLLCSIDYKHKIHWFTVLLVPRGTVISLQYELLNGVKSFIFHSMNYSRILVGETRCQEILHSACGGLCDIHVIIEI